MGSSMRMVPPQFISWGFQLIIKFWDQKIKIHFFFVKPNIDAAGFGILRMGHFTTIGLTLVANVEIKVCRTIVLEDV